MNEINNRILDFLKKNSKCSYREISKKLLIPVTTVHHRIKKLEKEGIIKKYSIVVDNAKLGNDIAAFVLIKVDYTALKNIGISQQQLAKKLKLNPKIENVTLITGFRDIIIKVRCKNIEELNGIITRDLRNLQGIESTETLVVLEEIE